MDTSQVGHPAAIATKTADDVRTLTFLCCIKILQSAVQVSFTPYILFSSIDYLKAARLCSTTAGKQECLLKDEKPCYLSAAGAASASGNSDLMPETHSQHKTLYINTDADRLLCMFGLFGLLCNIRPRKGVRQHCVHLMSNSNATPHASQTRLPAAVWLEFRRLRQSMQRSN